MKHQEQVTAAFLTSTPRSFEGKTYFRLNFFHEGKLHSVKSATDEAGKAGIVVFIEKGQPGTNGQPVAQDCFSLLMIVDMDKVATAKAAKALIKLEDLA